VCYAGACPDQRCRGQKKQRAKPVPPIIEYSDALIAKEEAKRRRRDRALQTQLKAEEKMRRMDIEETIDAEERNDFVAGGV